jgi:lipopolysaccharide export system protein LptC
MLLLARGSIWLLKQAQQPEQGATRQAAQGRPDYTMHQFRYTSAGKSGTSDYLVEGDVLSHYPDSNETVVQAFRMTRYDPSRPTMTLTSDSAKSNANRSEFRLYDNVVLQRAAGGNGETLVVTSDYMLVLTKQELVKTDRPVQAQQGSTILKGTGMIADSKQQTLALQSAVSATYLPPERVRR